MEIETVDTEMDYANIPICSRFSALLFANEFNKSKNLLDASPHSTLFRFKQFPGSIDFISTFFPRPLSHFNLR